MIEPLGPIGFAGRRGSTGGNPLDAVKYAGTEVQTDEEWARRKAAAELATPRLERERAAMAELIDGMVAKHAALVSTWTSCPAAPLTSADIRKAASLLDRASEQALDISRQMQDGVSAIARRRADQVDAHLERNWAKIQDLRARGVEVWLEEGPMEFERGQGGDEWSLRVTSTVRIRHTGDGLSPER